MKINLKTLQAIGTTAALFALAQRDDTYDIITGLMVAEAGANDAALLVHERCTTPEAIDLALERLCGPPESDWLNTTHDLRIAFYAALDACQAHYAEVKPCP